MARPTGSTRSRLRRTGFPSRLFDSGRDDYELYEDDGEFVLSVEMPGFDVEDISLTWDEGVLNVAAEHEDDRRSRTYHRRFRFPRAVDRDGIAAEYENGILEVRLPVRTERTPRGTEIEVQT